MQYHYVTIPFHMEDLHVCHDTSSFFHNGTIWGNELVIVFHGSATFHIDDLAFPIQKGDIFVIRNDYLRKVTQADNLHICFIHYREVEMQRLSGCYALLPGYQRLFIENSFTRNYAENERLQADDILLQRLSYFCELIALEQKFKDDGASQVLNSLFLASVTYISRAMNQKVSGCTTPPSHFTFTVAYMQEHYRENLTLVDLASMAHISPRHFDRKFKAQFSISPSKFLMNLRLNRACVLLEETNLSITEISILSGFSDANYFSACFKSFKNTSPTLYRNAMHDVQKCLNIPKNKADI